MKLYDLTLKKEVARECAWGVMGTITRIENKKALDLYKYISSAFLIFFGCRINGVDRINFYQCHFFNKKS